MKERLNILLNKKELKPRELEEMINLAVEELMKSGVNSNFIGYTLSLNGGLWNGYERARYIPKVTVVKAQERIKTILNFKDLGLLN